VAEQFRANLALLEVAQEDTVHAPRRRLPAALRKWLNDVMPATTSPCYKEAAARGFAAASISRNS